MRRSASEILRNLESRIARLEKQSSIKYNPNDLFKIKQGKGFIRIYVGGKYNNKRTLSEIKETFKSCFIYHFIPSNGLPPYNFIDDLVENAFDRSSLIEELSRVRVGEKAIQFNLYNSDNFLRNVIKELEMNLDDDLNWVLDWVDDYEADTAIKEAVKELMDKYGKVEPNKIDPRTYRLASTRKVAGHIVLAGSADVEKLRSELASTFGVEDIDFEDGVLSFLMDKRKYPKVEKEVKQVAKDFKVKFEKGEFTDGLGMIYTSSRRRRR